MTDWKKNFHFLSKTCPAAAIIIALFWYFGLPFTLSLSLSLSLSFYNTFTYNLLANCNDIIGK